MGINSMGTSPPSRPQAAQGTTNPHRGRSREFTGEHGFASLSRREREVLDLISLGMTDRQIADELVVSRVTISTHVAHILDKLGVPNRTAAVAQTANAAPFAGAAD
jgi:DNA-binding NarL/FixJ family response regulator